MPTNLLPYSLRAPKWPSRLTRAGLWVIAAGVLLTVVSGPANRFGISSFQVALLTLGAGFVVTMIGTAITIIGLLAAAAKRAPVPAATAAVGIVVGLAITGYLLSWISRARATPPIHDITTDLADPPSFVAVIPLRVRAHAVNSTEYVRKIPGPGGSTIDVPRLQQEYYPDIRPLELPLHPPQALVRARAVATQLGWRIDAYDSAQGRLEATAQTAFFGFQDDVVVRVRPSGTGSRIDVRSESRVGLGDVGANAARVRLFLERMAEH